MTTAIIFFLVLGVLVVVHELGHFWVAKRNGVRVDEFGFGFPPRILWKKIGETIYSFNLFPLGGFVKIFGENMDEGGDDPRSFINKKISQRAMILIAGVAMNVILAVVLFSFGAWYGVPSMIDESNVQYARDIAIRIGQVAQDSPAEKSGLKIGDKLKEFRFQDIKIEAQKTEDIQKFIQEHKGQELIVVVERGSEMKELKAVPRTEYSPNEGSLGIAMVESGIVSYPVYWAPIKGVEATYNVSVGFATSIYFILKTWIMDGKVIGDVMGPVGIFDLTGQTAKLGFAYLLNFVAILSINLAIINALPIPALDGGRLLFLAIEKIKGSPVNVNIEKYAHIVGFMLLILLMLLITFKDITKRFF